MPLPVPIRRIGYRLAYRALQVYWRLFHPSVTGVKCVLTDGDRVLLVRHTYGDRRWDLPGGTLKRGEDAATAARREMTEELGVSVDEWVIHDELWIHERRRDEHLHCFRAELHRPELRLDLGELAAACWFKRQDLPAGLARYVRPVIARAWP